MSYDVTAVSACTNSYFSLQHKYTNTPFGKGLGPLIFGITMFIGGIMTFYLPETNKQKIPETIREANLFGTFNR